MNTGKYTLFHGSQNGDIKEFDLSKAGKAQGCMEEAIYFTNDIETAKRFSREIKEEGLLYNRLGRVGFVYEAEVVMNNPLVLGDLEEKDFYEMFDLQDVYKGYDTLDEFISKMRILKKNDNQQLMKFVLDFEKVSKRYDGIIAKMYKDSEVLEYAVLEPKNIKILNIFDIKQEVEQQSLGKRGRGR